MICKEKLGVDFEGFKINPFCLAGNIRINLYCPHCRNITHDYIDDDTNLTDKTEKYCLCIACDRSIHYRLHSTEIIYICRDLCFETYHNDHEYSIIVNAVIESKSPTWEMTLSDFIAQEKDRIIYIHPRRGYDNSFRDSIITFCKDNRIDCSA